MVNRGGLNEATIDRSTEVCMAVKGVGKREGIRYYRLGACSPKGYRE